MTYTQEKEYWIGYIGDYVKSAFSHANPRCTDIAREDALTSLHYGIGHNDLLYLLYNIEEDLQIKFDFEADPYCFYSIDSIAAVLAKQRIPRKSLR